MIRAKSTVLVWTLAALAAPVALADDVRYYVDNGIQYRETTQVTQRPVTETRYEPQQTTVLRERYTTDLQESVRTYQVPVTEHQWVLGQQRSWNIFAPPTLSYRLMPVTRWETRTETVRVPVTKREYVPTQHVQHIPVTNTRIGEEKVVRREIVGPATSSTGTSVAQSNSFGGTSLDGDPPSTSSLPQQVDRRR